MSGKLFIVSAPSGAGKSTIISKVLKKLPFLKKPVSYTTRPPRRHEENGIDYHFISEKKFIEMKESGLFLESAKVHGNYYATSFEFINNNLKEGTILIKDIDVEGTKQILSKLKKDVITIFINTPSKKELEQRLTERKTDSIETIKKRLETAKKELEILEKTDIYKYTIINNDLEKAVDDLEKIIKENLQNDKSKTNR